MIKVGKVNLKNPVKLDVTADEFGNHVQYDGKEWLLYDSKEAVELRSKCLAEFNLKFKRN